MVDKIDPTKWVWIFNGSAKGYPGAVFSCKERADAWILSHQLTGTLTLYPVDVGVYDWALANSYFSPEKDGHSSAEFIGRFTTASQEHYHYEDGSEA